MSTSQSPRADHQHEHRAPDHHPPGHDHPHDHDPHGHDPHGHDHPHDHDHAHAHGGVRGWLTHLLVPHSHDASDSIDSELETSAAGIRAVKISLVVLLITSVLQLVVVVISGSVALLADTVHNFSDALTAIPLWIAFALTRRPRTDRFTYGLGRTEDLGGLFVIVMIAVSAVVAGYEGVVRLLNPQPPTHLIAVAIAGVVGFIGNEMVAVYRTRVGKRIGSAALVADGAHARADGLTSLAVVAGVIGVVLGFPRADAIVGLVIAVAITAILIRTGKDVVLRLLDGVDPAITEQVRRELARTHGVREVSELRVRWIGHVLNAEATLDLDPTLTLAEADNITHHAEHHLLAKVHRLRRATIHAAPVGLESSAARS